MSNTPCSCNVNTISHILARPPPLASTQPFHQFWQEIQLPPALCDFGGHYWRFEEPRAKVTSGSCHFLLLPFLASQPPASCTTPAHPRMPHASSLRLEPARRHPDPWSQPSTRSIYFPTELGLSLRGTSSLSMSHTPGLGSQSSLPHLERSRSMSGTALSLLPGGRGLKSTPQRVHQWSISWQASLGAHTGLINKFLVLITNLHSGNRRLDAENLESLLIWVK